MVSYISVCYIPLCYCIFAKCKHWKVDSYVTYYYATCHLFIDGICKDVFYESCRVSSFPRWCIYKGVQS